MPFCRNNVSFQICDLFRSTPLKYVCQLSLLFSLADCLQDLTIVHLLLSGHLLTSICSILSLFNAFLVLSLCFNHPLSSKFPSFYILLSLSFIQAIVSLNSRSNLCFIQIILSYFFCNQFSSFCSSLLIKSLKYAGLKLLGVLCLA